MRVEVLDHARFVHRPLAVSSKDAIPLRQLYQLLDGFKTPHWADPRQQWANAVSRFKQDVRALFPETADGSGVSHDWAKLLFIYPDPAHGSWKEVREVEGGKWEDLEPTGQLWFCVRLASELKNIRDGNGVDEVDDLTAIHQDLQHVKFSLLGYRAANVLRHNFNHASHLGYTFSDFLDLLNSISPPTLLLGHRIDEDTEDDFARYIATYRATLESEIDGEAGWHKIRAMHLDPQGRGESVLACFYIGICVLGDKMAIEGGGFSLKQIAQIKQEAEKLAYQQHPTSAPRVLEVPALPELPPPPRLAPSRLHA
ncbi:hypothetical protein JCM10296v2_002773 [Rhodotorula toruloides]